MKKMKQAFQALKDIALIFFLAIVFAVPVTAILMYGYSDIANDYDFFKRAMPLSESYLFYLKTSPHIGILEPAREADTSIPWPEPADELNYSSDFWYLLELNRGPRGEDLNVIKEVIIFPGKKVIWVEIGETGKTYKVNIPGDERGNLLYNIRTYRATFQEISPSFWERTVRFISNFILDNLILIFLFPLILVFFGLAGKRFFEAATRVQAKWLKRPKERFSDLGGLPEAIAQGELIKDFLRNPEKYFEIGARPIKGIILHGPPGTGKTLFTRALAGELGIPFLPISGEDFQSMFPGVAASRVKKIFSEAQKFAQSIIFIDEIDAIGRKRGTGQPTEQEDALTAILVRMQGIDDENVALQKQIQEFRNRFPNKKLPSAIRKKLFHRVIIIAATNRYDVLDPALVREGRFDVDLVIPLPDIDGRREILEIHSRNKALSPDIDLLEISKITPGFSGAALSDLMNHAAILAANSGKKKITTSEIEKGRESIVGRRKKDNFPEKIFILTPQEKWRLTVHQAGHALLRRVLMGEEAVIPISIIFGRKGYQQTFSVKELFNQKAIWTSGELYDLVAVAFGGIFAEAAIFPNTPRSTIGEGDVKKATELVHKIVREFGMAREIKFAYPTEEIGFAPSQKQKTKIEIVEEKIVIEREKRVEALCRENKALIEECAKILVAKETLEQSDLIEILKNAVDPNSKT